MPLTTDFVYAQYGKSASIIKIEPGTRYTLQRPRKNIDFCEMNLPIIPGGEIKVSIDHCGELKTKDFYEEGTALGQTFPPYEPVLSTERLTRRGNCHEFRRKYYPSEPFESCTLEKSVEKTPKDIRDRYFSYSEASSIASKLKDVSLEKTIKNVCDFVMTEHRGRIPKRETGKSLKEILRRAIQLSEDRAYMEMVNGEEDADYLTRQIEKGEGFYGSCKAFSTLACGLLNSLGLAARRVYGHIEKTTLAEGLRLTYEEGEHAWTEVYVPSVKNWVIADPAGAIITIPLELNYSYTSLIPLISKAKTDRFTIKLDYKGKQSIKEHFEMKKAELLLKFILSQNPRRP